MFFAKGIIWILGFFVCMGVPINKNINKNDKLNVLVKESKEVILEKIIPLEENEIGKEEKKEVKLSAFEKAQNIDLKYEPNEVGQVMVIMYHKIGNQEGFCKRSISNFKKDLEMFKKDGYVTVSLEDYVQNTMDVPAGKTPIVLTFDDGHISNFKVEEVDGEIVIDKESVVGIMEEFKKNNPDYSLTATFFLYGINPFMQEEYIDFKIDFLLKNGYQIGNHTYRHASFARMKNELQVEEAIGREKEFLDSFIDIEYDINTLAVPYGARSKRKVIENSLLDGKYRETEYKNIGIVNVGWDPNPSPISKTFDPYNIHRVTGGSFEVGGVGIENWMSFFRNSKKDKKRPMYISDGDSQVITVPKKYAEWIDFTKVKKDQYVKLYEME